MIKKVLKRIMASTLALSICLGGVNVAFANEKSKDVNAEAKQIVSNMTLEEKVGQMMMPDFRQWNGKDFTEMNDEVKEIIEKYHLGGVILFANNVKDTEQTVRLTDSFQKSSKKIPLFLTIDQEGGIVVRVHGGTNMPGNMAIGATNDPKTAYNVGKVIGNEVNALGININFAPDMDVNSNCDNPVIGVRSFGGDPDLVSKMGIAYMKGVQDAGVGATVKHFPGHGDTSTDTHLGLPIVPYDKERLKKVELKPFQNAIDNGVDMVMSAHIEFPALDDSKISSKSDAIVPATLSKKILTDLLRDEMGFKGVITTDALNMKAITDTLGEEEATIKTINAGTDIALMPAIVHGTDQIKDFDRVYNAVINAVKSGRIKEERINESAERIIALKIRRGIYDPNGKPDTKAVDEKIKEAKAIVGCEEHLKVEKEASDKAVTLIKNNNNILPFKMEENKKIVCLAPWNGRLKGMTETVKDIANKKGFKNIDIKGFAYRNSGFDEVQKAAIDEADYIILGSYTYNVGSGKPGQVYIDYPKEVLKYAKGQGKPVAVLSIRNPYEINELPEADAYLAVYGREGIYDGEKWQNIPSGIRAIFGEINPTGKLPVEIPTNDRKNTLYKIGYGLSYDDKKDDVIDNKKEIDISVLEKKGFKLGKDGRIIVKATNNSYDLKDVTLVTALYDTKSNKLVNYVAVSNKIEPKKSVKLSACMNMPSSGDYKVKCFVWDSLENMKSITDAVEIPVEK